jgi:threonine synthase
MSYVSHLRCVDCNSEYTDGQFRYYCPKCNGFLEVVYDIDRMKKELKREQFDCKSPNVLDRWIEFLPINNPAIISKVSLGEMVTPLLKAERLGKKLGLKNLWIKNESSFPTGSLKDRSMSVVVVKALEYGFDTVSIVSSGNAAASLSAYAARSGLKAVVFVARGNNSRLAKCRAYGSTIINVDAPYSVTEDLYFEAIDKYGWFDCSGIVNPFRLEGKKTLAYEICQALDWTSPDAVFVPTAFGSGCVSAWKGFNELKELGWISDTPRMYAVQPEECSPIVQAYERGSNDVNAVIPRPTVAASIAVGNPSIGGRKVIGTARESNGAVVGVEERLIIEAQQLLASYEGIFVEPSSATSVAAVMKELQKGNLSENDIIVASVTGIGLNDIDVVDKWAKNANNIEPTMESLASLLSKA